LEVGGRTYELYAEVSFTPPATVPAVSTILGDVDIEENSAVLKGEIVDTGGAAVDHRYIDWDTNSGEPYSNTIDLGAGEVGEFSTTIDLTSGTVVYVINRDDSGISIYRDNDLIGANNNYSFGTVGLKDGKWNSTDPTSAVWGTISHGAVYRKTLDTNARTALQSILTGGGTANAGGSILNSGSWDAYPIITIPGSVANPVITNTSTGETLDFTGATIPANTTYTIDTRYGYKTVTDSNAVNQIAKLSNDSDLSTFHLAPGVNWLEIESTTGTVVVSHYNPYLGL
jgi:hypothetical protein